MIVVVVVVVVVFVVMLIGSAVVVTVTASYVNSRDELHPSVFQEVQVLRQMLWLWEQISK